MRCWCVLLTIRKDNRSNSSSWKRTATDREGEQQQAAAIMDDFRARPAERGDSDWRCRHVRHHRTVQYVALKPNSNKIEL